jgi:hypothetical protein
MTENKIKGELLAEQIVSKIRRVIFTDCPEAIITPELMYTVTSFTPCRYIKKLNFHI